ncbi:MAG: cytochrome ubiquinol oxidase subunit I [Solirubrobacteraceae bacterium]|nr:cytochrome ubiquinol oxidase subunit I [Solirubrobacteraceae bacterium]
MTTLDLARLQFSSTTLFHFFFVPVSIGLSLFLAIVQTLAYRTGKPVYTRLLRLWGKVFLIIFAVGVVTGIVQEFQFGMNWSAYSKYVGDVFGAPLAIEGLAAFFVESTFLGLWMFGRDRLSPRLHAFCIWMVAIGTMASAYFILAANSWMQHPVGYELDPVTGQARMNDVLAVLTQSTALFAFAHTILASWVTAGMIVVGISAWYLRKGREVELARRALKIALPVTCVAAIAVSLVGHFNAQLMTEQQPMKMAAAEALWETEKPAGLSIFATGDFSRNPGGTNHNITIPHLLSLMAANDPNAEVKGIDEINAEYQRTYGPGDYVPVVGVAYWSFRAMIGAGLAVALLTLIGWILLHRRTIEKARRWQWLAVAGIVLPFLANSAGWLFTEMARQPWVVFGLLRTEDAISPNVTSAEVAITLIGFTLVYAVLAVIAVRLVARAVKAGPDHGRTPPADGADASETTDDLALAY